ncbi:type II toxin-antitoxin system VapB family antitoxin [Dyadobacter sp. 3J3]|uniref:type II toxin-antitoxin system VapB family antitoxin n=1 Tax=Dyadobacter sp. 3J3 TaxID=2606600 RepID=UPI0013579FD5|nr:type II toxin-antitoxin system VapB family antitoxin [Dyadobacter sp. 3J3]
MRTNVEIDESKIEKIRDFDQNLKTKKEIIDFALSELINQMRRRRLLDSKGKGCWDDDLEKMRTYDVPSF